MPSAAPTDNTLSNILAGLIAGLVTLTYSVTYAALIFSGDLTEYFAAGLNCALISASVVAFLVALRSSLPFAIAGPDSNASVLIGVMVANIAGECVRSHPQVPVIPTILVTIAISSLGTGLFLYALGRLKLGYLVRFIPYPVLGGFLAGTGWLISLGSFKVMTGTSLTFSSLPSFFSLNSGVYWLPGMVLAGILFSAMRRFKHFLVFPGIIVAAVLVSHLVFSLLGVTSEQMWQQGWVIKSFPANPTNGLWRVADPGLIRWDFILSQSGTLIVMVGVVVITILLNATGIELATKKDAELNQELSAAGLANIATGALGGLPGYISISRSVLNYNAGGTSRLSGITAALCCGVVFLFGSSLMTIFPKLILGGLLLYLGTLLLKEWLVDSWRTLSRLDYGLVAVITLVIASWGFLQGVTIGLIFSVILFVVSYSQIDIVKHTMSGVNHRSTFARPLTQQYLLKEKGEAIFILSLQGYLFFGTANKLLEQVRERFNDMSKDPARFIIFDFKLVTGLDSSVSLSFTKIHQLVCEHNAQMCYTDQLPEHRAHFEQSGMTEGDHCRFFSRLDYCMQWCEDIILDYNNSGNERSARSLQEQIVHTFLKKEQAPLFMQYLTRREAKAGEFIIHQGEEANSMYFIESGLMNVFLELPNDVRIRLITIGAGSVLGEMGLYTSAPRTASVQAEEHCVLYVLTRDGLERMFNEHPDVSNALHHFVVSLLAERLDLSNKKIQMLSQ